MMNKREYAQANCPGLHKNHRKRGCKHSPKASATKSLRKEKPTAGILGRAAS